MPRLTLPAALAVVPLALAAAACNPPAPADGGADDVPLADAATDQGTESDAGPVCRYDPSRADAAYPCESSNLGGLFCIVNRPPDGGTECTLVG